MVRRLSQGVVVAMFVVGANCTWRAEVLFSSTPMGGGPDASLPVDSGSGDGSAVDGGPPVPGASNPILAAGGNHTCDVNNGSVYCWGLNDAGEAGQASGDTVLLPTQVGGGTNYVAVVAGQEHSCALDHEGIVYCWGRGDEGQLGDGAAMSSSTPVAAALPEAASQIAAGSYHACAVGASGQLYCWGRNTENQLGQGNSQPGIQQNQPVVVGSSADWTQVSAGDGHTCGIRAAGELYCWGRNSDGECTGATTDSIQFTAPVRVGSDGDWQMVLASQSDTCGIRGNGQLYCWGANDAGTLGLGDTTSHPGLNLVPQLSRVALASGQVFGSGAILDGGSLWAWGDNLNGQLGVGDKNPRLAPVQVNADTWVSVAAGRFHMCARAMTGAVRCSGQGDLGQLGLGSSDSTDVLTDIGPRQPPPL